MCMCMSAIIMRTTDGGLIFFSLRQWPQLFPRCCRLAGGSLAEVFHEPAGQTSRLNKVRAEIWKLFTVPAIARQLFAKDTDV